MGYYFYDQYVIHPLSVTPLFHDEGSCFVPRITALDLLRFAMVGLVLLC